MKSAIYILLIVLVSTTSCDKGEEIKTPGTVAIVFDNKLGVDDLNLRVPGDQTYNFTDENGQQFNISKFGYYISQIKFSGPDGISYSDPNKITVDASKVTGFYDVLESDPASQTISVNNVSARNYDKIEFTIGVQSYTFIPGTPGGVLDPANGARFLNMEAGYVNLLIEGNASNSGQEFVSMGSEPDILEGTFSINLSGWKDVAPDPGQDPIFIDNTKTIELFFDKMISVEEGLNPEIHINVDAAKILEGIDFSQIFAVKRPDQSRSFSNKFVDAFTLDFVVQ